MVLEEHCGNSGEEPGAPDHAETENSEDIPDPESTGAVKFEVARYECMGGSESVASHKHLPET